MMYLTASLYVATFIGCCTYLNRTHGLHFMRLGAFAITAAGSFGCFFDLWGSLHSEFFHTLYRVGVTAIVLVHFGFDRRAAAKRVGPFERRLL